MVERWFYCEDLQPGTVVLSPAETQHARQSLRLTAGTQIILFDGCGHTANATILPTAPPRNSKPGRTPKPPRSLTVRVDAVKLAAEAARSLTLIVAGCKGARLDWLVEKCTELGVSRILLSEFERSVVHPGAQHVRKLTRASIEACKQCHRPRLPEIIADLPLNQAIDQVREAALLVANRVSTATPLASWLTQHQPAAQHLAIVVGPEGGLSPVEMDQLESAGAQPICLGTYTLRVETAAVAAAASWASSHFATAPKAREGGI